MAVAKAVSRGGGSTRQKKLEDEPRSARLSSAPRPQDAAFPVRLGGAEGSVPDRGTPPAEARQESAWSGRSAQGQGRQLSRDEYAALWQNFKLGYERQYGGAPRDPANRFGVEQEWGPQSTPQAIRTRMDDLGLSSDTNIAQTLNHGLDTDWARGQLLDRLGIGKYEGIDTGLPRAAELAEQHEPRLASKGNTPKSRYQDITREEWDGLSDAQQKAVLLNTWLREAETADNELDAEGIDKEFRNRYNYAFTGDIKEDTNAAYRPNTLAFLNTFGLRGEDNLADAQRRDLGITAAEMEQLRDFEIRLDAEGPRLSPTHRADPQRLVTNFEREILQGLDGYESGTPLSLQPEALVELDRVLNEEFTRRSSFLGSGARRETAADALDPLLGFGLRPDGSPDYRAMLFDAIAEVGPDWEERAIVELLAEGGVTPEDFYNFAGQRIRAVENSGGELPLGFSEGVWRSAEDLKRMLNIREA